MKLKNSPALKLRSFLMLFTFTICFSLSLSAQRLHIANGNYQSGKELLNSNSQDFLEQTLRQEALKRTYNFVQVPLDYLDKKSKRISIFYHLSKPLDQTKASIIFFNGGPGTTSLFMNIESALSDFNVIYFDQRGIGFSRPDKLEDLMNPKNFSSEFIARDAMAIIDNLGLKKVSIWGHSFGTAVATIFANKFPERISAVLLEGTIFDGQITLWQGPHRLKILQKYFNNLPEKRQQQIINLSESGKINKEWFSVLAQKYMYSAHAFKNLTKKLDDIFWTDPVDEQAMYLKNQHLFDSDKFMVEDNIAYGAFMFHQLACQELSASHPGSNFSAVFKDGILIPSDHSYKDTCLEIPGMEHRLGRTYFALKYPIKVPVTYIQGTLDGATTANQAILHYKYVAQGQKQILLAKNEGHAPLLSAIIGQNQEIKADQLLALKDIAIKSLKGLKVDRNLLKQADHDDVSWVMTNQN